MLTLCFSPAWWKHKPGNARFTGNLIGGTTILTANHLDFFVKDNIPPALGTIDFYLHERYNLISHALEVGGDYMVLLRTDAQGSNGVVKQGKLMKSQTPSIKLQTNLKFQY